MPHLIIKRLYFVLIVELPFSVDFCITNWTCITLCQFEGF